MADGVLHVRFKPSGIICTLIHLFLTADELDVVPHMLYQACQASLDRIFSKPASGHLSLFLAFFCQVLPPAFLRDKTADFNSAEFSLCLLFERRLPLLLATVVDPVLLSLPLDRRDHLGPDQLRLLYNTMAWCSLLLYWS